MAVPWKTLKKWASKDEFGVSKGAGETKKSLVKKLKKVMKDNLDDLTEEQLEWLSEETGEDFDVKPKRKKKKEKAKAKPKAKAKRKKKKKKEEPVEEKKPKRKKKKKKEEPEEEIIVETGPKALRAYAKEVDISTKGFKKWSDSDWEDLANKVFIKVDDMDDDQREELSEELFTFYTNVKSQQDEAPEIEIDMPKKTELKRWCGVMEIPMKGKSEEELAQELLDEFGELDDEDKEDLPDSYIEWASVQLGLEVPEKEEEPSVPLPEYKVLKGFAKELGFKLKDIKKAKEHPPTLVEMIMDAYDEEDEDEYSEELVDFVESMSPAEEEEEEVEEEVEEHDKDQLVEWLAEAGYEEEDLEPFTVEQLIAKLVEDYKDEDDREDLPEESVEFLKEVHPELFEKKKGAKKKKKKKKKK